MSDRFAVTMAAPLPRKPSPGQPWSHAETVALIEGYEEKWFSLNRGQLKAQQWEEVASSVASRCGGQLSGDPSSKKNGTQCRHKVEKLRKRYRSERLRPVASSWPYFHLMDRMESGAAGVRLRGAPPPPPDSESDDDDSSDSDDPAGNNTRSINGILGHCNGGGAAARAPEFPKHGAFLGRGSVEEEDDDDEEEEEDEDGLGGSAFAGVASVLRRLCDGFERLEKRRMESMREMHRDWIEMETKREEMMMESQAFVVESIAAAFASPRPSKKAKKSRDL